VTKNAGRLHAGGWFDHAKACCRQIDGGDLLTHAFDPGIAPTQEERHIGTELQAQLLQAMQGQVQAPQAIEGQQRGGGIGRAPAHPGLGRNAFVNADIGTLRGACGFLQQSGRAGDQVICGQGGCQVMASNLAVCAQLEVQRVAPVDQHEYRLQQVVAVCTAPRHVQEQIELGRGWNVEKGFHAEMIGKR